jgi:hypothetical protein
MGKCHVIGFRPTKEQMELIKSVSKDMNIGVSETMRTIINEYMRLAKKC